MLTVYSLKRPSDMVVSVDRFFDVNSVIVDTPVVRDILCNVEKGKYLNEVAFISRTGEVLPKNSLSTGVKSILNLLQYPNKVFNMQEMGNNLAIYLGRVLEGTIYLPWIAYTDFDFFPNNVYSVDLEREFPTFAECIAALYELFKSKRVIVNG